VIELPGIAEVWAALPEARMVGGAVRDMLAGRVVADVDFASPLTPQDVMARARRAGLKAVPTGLAHGTVTLVAQGRQFEVTTLRRDVQTDGRHAVVAFTDDWVLDASRRDFTINAMSAAQSGEVFDYFGGREDLAAGRLRFVGVAAARIAEDYLRIFRFFRFFARYAKGAPDEAALAAIAALKDGVARLSAERVWREMKLILLAEDPRAALRLMAESGVLALVLPEADLDGLDGLMRRGAPADALLRLAALSSADAAGYAARWKLSGAECEALSALRIPNALLPGMDDAALRRALAVEPAEILIARTWLAQDDGAGWDGLRARLSAMEKPVFPLLGRDITKLGVPQGPAVGEILKNTEQWWRDGGCVADAAQCLVRAMAEL